MLTLKKNVPVCEINGIKLYGIEKLSFNSGEYFKLETKILVNCDENDPLNNDVRRTFIMCRAEVLKNKFKGHKPTDLVNKEYDLLVQFTPMTRHVNPKEGNSFSKTEWLPEILDIGFAGEVLAETRKPTALDDEEL